jgi:hypothetical protein
MRWSAHICCALYFIHAHQENMNFTPTKHSFHNVHLQAYQYLGAVKLYSHDWDKYTQEGFLSD